VPWTGTDKALKIAVSRKRSQVKIMYWTKAKKNSRPVGMDGCKYTAILWEVYPTIFSTMLPMMGSLNFSC
jgi:hypothetical protein